MTRFFVALSIAISILVSIGSIGCESVPNISFAGDDSSEGGPSIGDASNDVTQSDGSIVVTNDGAVDIPDGAIVEAAADVSSPTDASSPSDAAVATNTCPTVPKYATSCCGQLQITCNGKCDVNDCLKCQQCGRQMLCCPDKKFACVKLGDPCPS